MRASGLILLMALLCTVLTASMAAAETVYVSDRLVITVREIPEENAPTISNLQSDEALELLEDGDVFLKVRLPDGSEGYVKKQYITRDTPTALRLVEANKQLAQQKQQVATLKERLADKEADKNLGQGEAANSIAELKQSLAESTKELEAADKRLAELQADYNSLKSASENVVALVTARDELQQEYDRLNDELNSLRADNSFLLKTFFIKWFLAGAGVLLLGWLIGRSAQRKRRY